MDAKEKISEYLKYKGISIYRLEADSEMSKGYWYKTKSISAEVLARIACVYSDLSAEWLLRGKGDMILKEDNTPAPASVDHDELVALRAENRVLRELLNLRNSEKKNGDCIMIDFKQSHRVDKSL